MTAVLEVVDLTTRFATHDGEVMAADHVGFAIDEGESLGVVGESGSGKTQIFLAVMGLLAKNGRSTGSVRYRGTEILNLPPRRLNKIRGADMAMIFQDPMTSLNPFLRISRQMTEVLREHKGMSEAEARKRGIAMLDLVGIPEAARRFDMYPHEFSGGMRQRVMIAMALLCEPDLLIADEPTTALDVTVQAQILELLARLKRELGMAIALITHDLGVVAGLCDRVMVMYAGRAVELELLEPGLRIVLVLGDSGFAVASRGQAPAAVIRAHTMALWRLVRGEDDADRLFFDRALVMEGDTEFGLELKNTLDAIGPLWR